MKTKTRTNEPGSERMTRTLQVKLSDCQLKQVQESAEKAGMTASAFARHHVLKAVDAAAGCRQQNDIFEKIWAPQDAAAMRDIAKQFRKFFGE